MYAFEVRSIADVKAEIFGPVLQVVRWSGEPPDVITQVNALGFGLTMGLQTRIDSRAQAMARAAHAHPHHPGTRAAAVGCVWCAGVAGNG